MLHVVLVVWLAVVRLILKTGLVGEGYIVGTQCGRHTDINLPKPRGYHYPEGALTYGQA